MARTITWTGATSNDATVGSNWTGGISPGFGDTAILPGTASSSGTIDYVGQGGTTLAVFNITIDSAATADAINFTDASINGGTITSADGSAPGAFTLSLTDTSTDTVSWFLGDFATLDLTGSTPTSTVITSSGSGDSSNSVIKQLGTGDQLTINATGTVSNDGQLWLQSKGGQAALNIAQDGTNAGFYGITSALLVLGETLTVSGDTNTGTRFSNNGFMLVDGQTAPAAATLDARINNITGETDILGGADGASLDVDTNMPGAQSINFGDSAGLLQIEANTTLSSVFNVGGISTTVLQGFFGRITGFKPGDVIKLVGVDPTGLTYSFGNNPNFGPNVLTINRGSAEVALLRFPSANLVDGTGTIGGANTGQFVLTNDGSGDTEITVTATVAQWNGVTNGATTDWSAANWTGGSGAAGLPGQFQAAEISLTPDEGTAAENGSFPTYVITVSSAETVGSVAFDDPLASMIIAAPLTLAAQPGQSGGGEFVASTANGVSIATGATLTTTRYYAGNGGKLSLEPGGLLNIAGVASFTAGAGLAGLDVEGNGDSTGGTINSAGNIIIGQNSDAGFTAENNIVSSTDTSVVYGSVGSDITASYTQVGGAAVAGDANQQPDAFLRISGPNTTWSDIGGDASTQLSGAMLVGGGEPSLNDLDQLAVNAGGAGMVEISDGATLTDQLYSLIGLAKGSSGTVELDGGAQWLIGLGAASPPTSVVVGNSVVGTGTLYGGDLPRLVVGSGGTGTLNVNSSTVEVGAAATFDSVSMIVGNGNSSNATATGVVMVQGGGALLDTAGPMIVAQRSNGFLTVSSGGTVSVSSEIPTADIEFGLAIGNQSGTGTISGVVDVSAGGLLIDHGDLVDGHVSAGTLSVGGSVQVDGGMYLGGLLSLIQGTTAIASPELFKGSGSGTLDLSGSGAMTVSSGTLDMWQGSGIDLNGGALLAIGNTGSTAPLAGELTVAAGATLQGAGSIVVVSTPSTLRNFGTVLAGGLTNAGAPSQVGATLELNAVLAGPGVFAVAPGGTLQLDNGVVNTSSFDFGTHNFGTTAVQSEFIRVLSPVAFQGTVGDFFGNGNRIDFVGASDVPGSQPTYTPNANPITGGTVQVATGDGTLTFHVTGSHPNGFFDAVDPGGTGTQVVANDASPCFAAGTRILTASGEIAVEDLRVGDRLPTLAGALRSVRWIGWTCIDLDRHAHPERAAPVRVQAHAFGPGRPHRELLLSPDHAVALDGGLIPIHLLVNGASIVRAPAHGMVRYFHVELDAHAILLADGLPAESYLDTGNRGQFANADAARVLHPDLTARAWDKRACAPLLLGGARVVAAHAEILARATELGHRLTDDPGFSIIADGVALGITLVSKSRLRVTLPAGTREVFLNSRRSVPRELDGSTDDHRPLGVAIVAARHCGRPIDDEAFGRGFYPSERYEEKAWRWTDGEARLDLPPRSRSTVLELRLRPDWRRYWDTPPTRVARQA